MKKAILIFALLIIWNISLTLYCHALQRAIFELALLVDDAIVLMRKDARNMTNVTLLLNGMQELNPAYIDKAMRGK